MDVYLAVKILLLDPVAQVKRDAGGKDKHPAAADGVESIALRSY